MRILLVEDNATDATLFELEFKRVCHKLNLARASNLKESSEYLKKDKFDVALVDLSLPDSSGARSIRELRRISPHLPIVVLTGLDDEATALKAIQSGADDYLVKGHTDAKTILRTIRYAIERHRLLNELGSFRQAQKLEVMGQLAGGVAHDFNNLLTVIKGYTDLSLHELDPKSKMYKNLKEVQKAADRATFLTKQLLSFGRQGASEPQLMDLNQKLTDMHKALLQLIGGDVELKSDFQTNVGYIYIDPTQIEQVVMNMAVNARHAMPNGGNLQFKTYSTLITSETYQRNPEIFPGEYVVLQISDTGVGMSKEIQKRIFDPFFTTKPTGKGTGLGLTTCSGVIKQNGGHIEVESELNKGTTFTIYLPKAEPRSLESKPTQVDIIHASGTETILMVEDEKPVLDLANEFLSKNGYKILTASNGAEALNILTTYQDNIDLLITDVIMPKMGGTELVESIPSRRANMKVMFLAGYADRSAHKRISKKYKNNLLPKPFSLNILSEKVREVLLNQ
jgi:two-component system cell cycle sensor histidine kinase/response regulator CckA